MAVEAMEAVEKSKSEEVVVVGRGDTGPHESASVNGRNFCRVELTAVDVK